MELEFQGSVRDLPFAGATAFLAHRRATGVLELEDEHGINRAFFLDGHPQGAKLSQVRYPLGRVLATTGLVAEVPLANALEEQKESHKLLGQILVERQLIDDAQLQTAFEEQSRLGFLSLFGHANGRYQFHAGLVHLSDFTSAPMTPILAIYRGVRDFAPSDVYEPLLARVALASIALTAVSPESLATLPDAERQAIKLLEQPTLSGIVARDCSLSPKAIASLIYALYSLGALRIGPAQDAAP